MMCGPVALAPGLMADRKRDGETMSKVDILIRNGRVIDPYRGVDCIEDVAVKDGLITAAEGATAAQTVDAAGCIVTPGLIDYHCHLGAMVTDLGLHGETMCFPTGVTTVVDPGTTGTANYEAFRSFTACSRLRVKAFLNVCPTGMVTTASHENYDPALFQRGKILRFLKKYADQLLGLKVRQSIELVGGRGLEPMRAMIDIAEEAGCRVAVHTTNPPVKVEEIARLLRPGDIYVHVYQGKGESAVREGRVVPELFAHQKRGVIFDAANGTNHFNFAVARQCLAEGLLPDVISTDLTVKSAYLPYVAFSLPFVMSKYLSLGLSLPQVIERTVTIPARLLGQERELGSLCLGTCADIAVHRLIKKPVLFKDSAGATLQGGELLKTEMTVRDGETVFRQIDFQ